MKLTHSKAGTAGVRCQHAPTRHFSKLAGLALLGTLGFAPMTLPAKAMAQEARPVAATPAADTVKSTRIYYSFLRLKPGGGYLSPQLKEVQNVPLEIREVEEQGSVATVAKANASPREEFSALLDLSTGPGASFRDCWITAEIGGGTELYLQFMNRVRDTAAWYAVHAGGPLSRGSLDIKPYLYSEIRVAPNGTYCDEIGFSVGYRVYYERFVATNGVYDTCWTYGGHTEPWRASENGWYPEGDYSSRKSYDLISLVTGMLYVSFVRYENKNMHGSIYLGFKHVISSRVSDVASQAHFVFHNPAVAFGIRMNLDILHTP